MLLLCAGCALAVVVTTRLKSCNCIKSVVLCCLAGRCSWPDPRSSAITAAPLQAYQFRALRTSRILGVCLPCYPRPRDETAGRAVMM